MRKAQFDVPDTFRYCKFYVVFLTTPSTSILWGTTGSCYPSSASSNSAAGGTCWVYSTQLWKKWKAARFHSVAKKFLQKCRHWNSETSQKNKKTMRSKKKWIHSWTRVIRAFPIEFTHIFRKRSESLTELDFLLLEQPPFWSRSKHSESSFCYMFCNLKLEIHSQNLRDVPQTNQTNAFMGSIFSGASQKNGWKKDPPKYAAGVSCHASRPPWPVQPVRSLHLWPDRLCAAKASLWPNVFGGRGGCVIFPWFHSIG